MLSHQLSGNEHKISKPLAYLINNCFEKGCFPDILKLGLVNTLLTGGDRSQMINYKPVNLVSNIAKIIEKLILVLMEVFIKKKQFLSRSQFGFRMTVNGG